MSVERIFAGDDTQYFPDLGRWVKPGDSVEFDSPPDDPRFVTASQAKKDAPSIRKARSAAEPAPPAPETPVEPSTSEED
jgi:hypothetical protein